MRKRGEPLNEHIDRLAALDLARIRVHPDYIDDKGNIVVKPVIILGKDTSDDIRPIRVDTSGRVDVTGVIPELQDDAVLTQTNPTSGTKYTVLDTTEYCELISAHARVTWTGQPDPLEIHVTADNATIVCGQANPVSTTDYEFQIAAKWLWGNSFLSNSSFSRYYPFRLRARSMKVEAETTGGTVQQLYSIVKYATW